MVPIASIVISRPPSRATSPLFTRAIWHRRKGGWSRFTPTLLSMTRYNPVIAKLDAWQVTTVDQVRSTLTALVTSRLRW